MEKMEACKNRILESFAVTVLLTAVDQTARFLFQIESST
jgi:hypothetical protein